MEVMEVRFRFFFSTPFFALSMYSLYLSLIFALTHLSILGDEPSLTIDLLPVALGIFVPAISSFIFLRKKKMSPGFFG
ncbi:hypothetical protein [Thermococcus sp.]|uniref:hypothetical protein n=1 Tax=Thermococcus sp. TaxID=35749 RepID=UPI0026299C94|nr:hypothetical protein [Thermococcus sp.]